MFKFKLMWRYVIKKLRGQLRDAVVNGAVIEPEVTLMGGVDFGSEPYLITLKHGARISSDVKFITHDGGTWAFRNTNEKYQDVIKYGRIVVGEYSFIGESSIIMPGVHIGNNCVVAAGSVVTHDVPDMTVVGGVPARTICTTEEYAEKCLLKMKVDFDKDAYMRNKKAYLLDYLKE